MTRYYRNRVWLAVSMALSMPALADDTSVQADTIETIEVVGRKLQSFESTVDNGVLGSGDILDTPFSVTTIGRDDIDQRQVSNLDALFSRDASIAILGGSYSNWGSTASIRGLPLDYTNSFKINGLPFNNFSGEMPYEVFDHVDVLKGATGFMYGFAAPGGIVNYVTKKATGSVLAADAGWRSDSIYSVHVDAGTRFGSGDRFGLRSNIAYENGDTTTDGGSIERKTASVAWDAQLMPDLTWTADLIYNDRDIDNVTTWFFNSMSSSDSLPKPVDGSRNISAKGTFEDGESIIAQTGINWQFASDWRLKVDYSHTENNTRWVKTLGYLQNSDGDLRIRVYDQAFDTDFDLVQPMILGNFETGPISHKLVTGVSYQNTTSYRSDATRVVVFLSGLDNLYTPNTQSYDSTFTKQMAKAYYVTQRSAFVSDTLSFTPQWNLLLGVRAIDYDSANYLTSADYSTNATTPTVALIYKPTDDSTVYASYVESLEEGSVVGTGYENEGEMLDALESKQYELGVKIQQPQWQASAALFRIERGAEYGNADNYYVQDGESRFTGLEVDGLYRLADDWTIHANLMKLDTEYAKTGGSSIEGNDVLGAPDWQGALGVTYNVAMVPGLTVDAGAKYYGARYLDEDNYWKLPDYTLFDASASYAFSVMAQPVVVRGTVTNLADKKYWATDGTEGLRIGESRQFAVSASMNF